MRVSTEAPIPVSTAESRGDGDDRRKHIRYIASAPLPFAFRSAWP